MQYPIAIFQQNNHYYVTIPDMKTLSVADDTMAGAVANARLAILNHLQRLVESDLPIPEPSPVTNHLTKPEYAGYIWAIVSVDLGRIMGEAMEISISLPHTLGNQVMQQFPHEPLDRVIVLALKQYLKTHLPLD